LTELGFGPENEAKAIHLCEGCLTDREERTWSVDDDIGRRLRDALHQRRQASRQRYTYLEEPDTIHLVRLQPEWVDNQASDV
jgi:hypothetical protein